MARRRKQQASMPSAKIDPTVIALMKEMRAGGQKFTNQRNPDGARTRKAGKRGGFFRRKGNRGGGPGGILYSAVSGDFGIQVGCSISEFAAALAMTAGHVVVESTETTADDKAFPYVAGVLATLARYGADKYLAKKHPGLAKVASAGASAANGVNWSQKAMEWGVKVQDRVAKRAVKSGS